MLNVECAMCNFQCALHMYTFTQEIMKRVDISGHVRLSRSWRLTSSNKFPRAAKAESIQQQHQQRPAQRQQQNSVTASSPPSSTIPERQFRQRQHQRTYHDEEYEPASEIESDRQQRVYRGQPSTIGQVQRDRDGLRRNIISVSYFINL